MKMKETKEMEMQESDLCRSQSTGRRKMREQAARQVSHRIINAGTGHPPFHELLRNKKR